MALQLHNFPFGLIALGQILIANFIVSDLFLQKIIFVNFKVVPLEVHKNEIADHLQEEQGHDDKTNPSRFRDIVDEQDTSIDEAKTD